MLSHLSSHSATFSPSRFAVNISSMAVFFFFFFFSPGKYFSPLDGSVDLSWGRALPRPAPQLRLITHFLPQSSTPTPPVASPPEEEGESGKKWDTLHQHGPWPATPGRF